MLLEMPPVSAAEGGLAVSVVIPAYNAQEFLGRAILSALVQTVPPHEIIVVDDGSTDGTREIAESFGPPVRLICQHQDGASAARNRAIRAATAPLIAFLDADDEWLPKKLEQQLPLHRDAALSFSFSRS